MNTQKEKEKTPFFSHCVIMREFEVAFAVDTPRLSVERLTLIPVMPVVFFSSQSREGGTGIRKGGDERETGKPCRSNQTVPSPLNPVQRESDIYSIPAPFLIIVESARREPNESS